MRNATTRVTENFISILLVKDPRFEINCYGAFFDEIPKRLGYNVALDQAANALATSFPTLHTQQRSGTALNSYSAALTAMRACLQDPLAVRDIHTLCAVYMLLICQV